MVALGAPGAETQLSMPGLQGFALPLKQCY